MTLVEVQMAPGEGTAFHRTQPAGKHGLNLTKRKRWEFSGPAAKDPPGSAGVCVHPIPGPGRVYMLQGTDAGVPRARALQQGKPLQ